MIAVTPRGHEAAHLQAQAKEPERAEPKQAERIAVETLPMLARPTALKMPASVLAIKAAVSPGYAEMVAHLEPMIQKQLAEVQALMDANGVTPADVKFVYTLDITGKEVQVCLACGRIGHDYMPTMVRLENPEINMLSESVVVFLEVSKRLGVQYGLVAYDDKGVLPLRPVKSAGSSADQALVLQRFDAFRQRHNAEVRDVTDRAWMAAEMKNWQGEWANRKMAGDALDEAALAISQKMLGSASNAAMSGIVLAKSEPPKNSLQGARVKLGSGKPPVKVATIAVGKQAADVARAIGGDSVSAVDLHGLREQLGSGMKLIVRKAGAV